MVLNLHQISPEQHAFLGVVQLQILHSGGSQRSFCGNIQRETFWIQKGIKSYILWIQLTKKTWKITMLLMGKSSISMAIFHSYVSLPEGNWKAFKFKCLCKTNVCRPSVEAMNGCQGYVHWTLRRSQSHALRCGYGAWTFNGFNPSPISKMLLGITIQNMAAKLISK